MHLPAGNLADCGSGLMPSDADKCSVLTRLFGWVVPVVSSS